MMLRKLRASDIPAMNALYRIAFSERHQFDDDLYSELLDLFAPLVAADLRGRAFSASIRCAEGAGSSRRASVEERPGSIGQGAG